MRTGVTEKRNKFRSACCREEIGFKLIKHYLFIYIHNKYILKQAQQQHKKEAHESSSISSQKKKLKAFTPIWGGF